MPVSDVTIKNNEPIWGQAEIRLKCEKLTPRNTLLRPPVVRLGCSLFHAAVLARVACARRPTTPFSVQKGEENGEDEEIEKKGYGIFILTAVIGGPRQRNTWRDKDERNVDLSAAQLTAVEGQTPRFSNYLDQTLSEIKILPKCHYN